MNLNEIVNEKKDYVKNIIKSILKQNNEDLEQEVYIKIIKNADKYQERGKSTAWLKTIVINTVKDFFKSAMYKREQSTIYEANTLLNVTSNKMQPDENLISLERQRKIIAAINNLKPKFKEIIILCEINGLSYVDAAKKLNCPLGTIKSRLYNAKKILAEELIDLL